jgi:excisionase family DNA binding protein
MRPYEVAIRLGVHENTVKRIHPEHLPYWRVGNRGDRRYDPDDVDRYITVRTVR